MIRVCDKFVIHKHSRYYTVINVGSEEYEKHGHFIKRRTAENIIRMITRKIIPKSCFLRESVIRLSTDEKYIETVSNKIEKDKQKPKFININKGV